ncbi:outer envelope protein [Pseudoduganella sp. UC29_71]|uniref:outer envelope protein n=1 Tax=Pseudoduganella sp. UC29_71 TaxID=3350174 RepID=UPI00366C2121
MQKKFMNNTILAAYATFALLGAGAAQAVDWSDTALSYRYGTHFAEPFNPADIKKNILNLSHVNGYAYGKNFISADLLLSDKTDPESVGSDDGARELYVLYRHTLDLGKVTGKDFKMGAMRGLGLTAGFDFNVKHDAGYNSRKRMFVAGPTLNLDVPGFLDISLLALWESNAPYNGFSKTSTPRYDYDVHPMLNLVWGIPFNAGVPLSFEGYANFIGSKGKDEFGGGTKPETNIDMQVMYDMSAAVGAAKNTFKVGIEYQFWKNKFGNSDRGNPGATARTPMVRAEYHF